MTSLATRLSGPADTTIFERMSGLAREFGAINLGQGFPELPEPPELIAAAQAALAEHSNQYPPMRGLPRLRGAVADYYARTQGLELTADNVVITSGGTEALAASLFALSRRATRWCWSSRSTMPICRWCNGPAAWPR